MSDFKSDTKGLDNLNKVFKDLGKMYTDVGVLEGNAYPDTGMTVAEVGAIQEFGSDKLGRDDIARPIPARSFIEFPIESRMKKIVKDVSKGAAQDFAEGGSEKIMNKLGAACDKQIQLGFETGGFGKWKPLAPFTIRKKKSSSILIDTSLLRKSISWRIGKK